MLDLHDLSLEDIKRLRQAGLTWKLIPLYYCPGKEGKACVVLVSSQPAILVFSSSRTFLQILILINGNKGVSYLIECSKSRIHSSLFKGSPVQTTEHVRYAGYIMVQSSYPSCCYPLNHLELTYQPVTCFVAFFGTFDTCRVSYCVTVFKFRTDNRFVGFFLNFARVDF